MKISNCTLALATLGKVFAAVTLCGVVAFAACVDWKPVTEDGNYGERKPVNEIDAAESDASAAVRPCELCARSLGDPGCGQYLVDCNDDLPCRSLFDCAVAKRCLEQQTQDEIFQCAFPCLDKAGISDPAAPAVQELFPMIACVQSTCGPICRGQAGDD